MRNGFKIFDTDTHNRPSAESIRPFLSQPVLDRIPDLEEHRVPIKVGMAGEVRTEPYRHWYRFRQPGGGGWGSIKPRYLGEAGPREGEASIEEIKRWGKSDWCVAIHPKLPLDFPVDHPDMNPIWAAAQDEGLAVIHHSFAIGYPGYRDLWDNPFLGHPWGAMRAVGAFFGSGIMDRFPYIRYGVLESGFGWLPFWARRMDDQAIYMGYVAENLEYKLSEYMTGGRFFAGIVLHEGESMVKMVTDDLGDHVLTFGSDYPHSESRFPGSADIPLSWKSLSEDQLRKLLWDNPVRFFGEP